MKQSIRLIILASALSFSCSALAAPDLSIGPLSIGMPESSVQDTLAQLNANYE